MIPDNIIQQLQFLSIEAVAERLNIHVQRHKSICPFHHDTHPSLTFNPRNNRYRCYVCDAHGGNISLVMSSQKWGFVESCHWLCQEFGIDIPSDSVPSRCFKPKPAKAPSPKAAHSQPTIDTPYLEYLLTHSPLTPLAQQFLFQQRHISPQVVAQLGLGALSQPAPMAGNPHCGWYNAPALLLPYRSPQGSLLSLQARYLGTPSPDGTCPRFQFPRGSRCAIFNLPVINTLSCHDYLWITEGVTDCLAMLSMGHKAIAIPSATLLSAADIDLLSQLSAQRHITYHMAPDSDAPGLRLFQSLSQALPHMVYHQLPTGFKDIGEWWSRQF